MKELRWIYDRRDVVGGLAGLGGLAGKVAGEYPKLCDWVEQTIEETLSFYCLPLVHHKHLKSTNTLERLNEEIKRRTHVVRIFPNEASCLRLVRALAMETHENWIEATRYLTWSSYASSVSGRSGRWAGRLDFAACLGGPRAPGAPWRLS